MFSTEHAVYWMVKYLSYSSRREDRAFIVLLLIDQTIVELRLIELQSSRKQFDVLHRTSSPQNKFLSEQVLLRTSSPQNKFSTEQVLHRTSSPQNILPHCCIPLSSRCNDSGSMYNQNIS